MEKLEGGKMKSVTLWLILALIMMFGAVKIDDSITIRELKAENEQTRIECKIIMAQYDSQLRLIQQDVDILNNIVIRGDYE